MQATGVKVDISKPGQLMGELAELAKSNPEKFKTVAAEIAQQLKTAAGSESGGRAAMIGRSPIGFRQPLKAAMRPISHHQAPDARRVITAGPITTPRQAAHADVKGWQRSWEEKPAGLMGGEPVGFPQPGVPENATLLACKA